VCLFWSKCLGYHIKKKGIPLCFKKTAMKSDIVCTSADEYKDKKEVNDFTPEQKKEALMKEYNNLVSTGTIELVPNDQVKDIPLSKQITSHSFHM
jgi:hypothetical protein